MLNGEPLLAAAEKRRRGKQWKISSDLVNDGIREKRAPALPIQCDKPPDFGFGTTGLGELLPQHFKAHERNAHTGFRPIRKNCSIAPTQYVVRTDVVVEQSIRDSESVKPHAHFLNKIGDLIKP